MQKIFIKTTDENTRNTLIKEGFQELLSSETGVYVFLNCNKMQFSSDVDISKLHYTNVLCM